MALTSFLLGKIMNNPRTGTVMMSSWLSNAEASCQSVISLVMYVWQIRLSHAPLCKRRAVLLKPERGVIIINVCTF